MPALNYKKLVKRLGGTKKASRALNVSMPSVCGWVSSKHGMSAAVAIRAERVTDGEFKAEDLCPALKLDLNNNLLVGGGNE
ncbi:YdaS family helix-turn-helix protein [Marinagarivorans algicola]|uniref:YdaS family helix-turn-helix protein n=1 Tax=Marinagarivorans algicola TaxID=1513270 RepID=UPI0006B4EA8A|nr:YdaS family helix-turn-helix protein [Marinagarivorans algicola]